MGAGDGGAGTGGRGDVGRGDGGTGDGWRGDGGTGGGGTGGSCSIKVLASLQLLTLMARVSVLINFCYRLLMLGCVVLLMLKYLYACRGLYHKTYYCRNLLFP
jgi:hypothetical protein